MLREYLKVKWDYCPKCRGIREVVVQGICSKTYRREKDHSIIGWDCKNCGDSKLAEMEKQGLDNLSLFHYNYIRKVYLD